MSEEELNEAIEYNQEYMEAMQSEEIFGGDYTSSVELKYANKTIDNLLEENKQLKEAYDKEKYLTDKLTKQLTDEYKNTETQYELKNEYKNIIDEAIDTLYCWGEVLDPKFQNKMLDVLKGSDSNE